MKVFRSATLPAQFLRFGSLQVLSSILASCLFLVFAVLIVRSYPPDVMGAVGIGLAFPTLAGAVLGFGLGQLVYREAADDAERARVIVARSTRFRAKLSIPLVGASLVVMATIHPHPGVFLLVVVGGLSNFVAEPALLYLIGARRFLVVAVLTVLQRAIPVVGLVLLLGRVGDWLPGACYMIGTVGTSLYVLWVTRLPGEHHSSGDPWMRDIIEESWPLGVATLGEMASARLSLLLLGFIEGAVAAGIFSPILQVIFAGAGIAYSAMVPLVSLFGQSEEDTALHRRARKAGPLILVVSGLCVLAAQPFLSPTYELLFGTPATDSVKASLHLLTISVPFILASRWLLLAMILERDYRAVMRVSMGIGLANLFVGVAAISYLGLAGAGLTVLLAEIAGGILALHWMLSAGFRKAGRVRNDSG